MKGKKLILLSISFFCLSLCVCFEVFMPATGFFIFGFPRPSYTDI